MRIYIVCLHFIAELWLCFDIVRKSRSAIAELRYTSIESKSLLQKLLCISENTKFKVRLLFCALNGLNSRCVLLQSAFCKILFVPASGKYYFSSTACLLKKKNVTDNFDNKIQTGLNIIIHISHVHLQ